MIGADMDLTTMPEDDFEAHEQAVRAERERRDNLDRIPEQIEMLMRVFRNGGGDEEKLQDALTVDQLAALPSVAGVAAK